MSWQCPECDFRNKDNMVRCVCGYEMIESLEDNQKDTKISWKLSVLEAIVIFIASAAPTFIMGLFWGNIDSNDNIGQIEFKIKFFYAAWAIQYIGFILIGCLHRNNRFPHLFAVAFMLWLFGFSQFIIKPFSFEVIGRNLIHLVVAAVFCGLLSFIIVRPDKVSQK